MCRHNVEYKMKMGLKIRYIKDLNYLVFQQFLSSKTTFNCRNCRKQTLIINQSIFSVV